MVLFFSRLTHTLENACGRDALARRLSALRREPDAGDNADTSGTALTRAFRRLGLLATGDDAALFLSDFCARIGQAVARPDRHVRLLLRLFSAGDDELPLKPVCGATPQCQLCQLTRECDHFNTPRKPEMTTLPPAARLMSNGDQALSDAELLGIILFGDKGTGREPVVATLLTRYGRLRAVFRADGHEFAGIRGISPTQSLRLAAVSALHQRLLAERRGEMLRITSAQDIYDRYSAELRDYRGEAAVLLMLDQQNCVMRDAWFCGDSATLAQVAIADLLRPAVREFAVRVALVHNHPGNDASPSFADIDFTRRLRSACDIIGLGLVDHVIVAESGYYSFAENGMLGA